MSGHYAHILWNKSQIIDEDFPAVAGVAHINGYFLWITKDSGQFIWSEIVDGQDYDALDFATAEKSPDNLVGIVVDHEQVLLFGSSTIETWVSTGNFDSAFEPIPGTLIERGTASGATIVKTDNTVFFVGNDLLVYRLEGNTPQRISTFGVEESLSRLEWVNRGNLEAYGYSEDGHTFYVLTIPNGPTYVYDLSVGMWHQRRSWGRDDWGVGVLARDLVLAGL